MSTSIKDLKRVAEAQGWRVESTKGSHIKFTPPDRSKPAVILAGTSCSRVGLKNALSALKRSGLVLQAA